MFIRTLLILFMLLAVLLAKSVYAEQQRDISTLLEKIEKTVPSLRSTLLSGHDDQLEFNLGNSYVQAINAITLIRVKQKKNQPLSEFGISSQEQTHLISPQTAFQRIADDIIRTKLAFHSDNLQKASNHLHEIITTLEFIFYHTLQNRDFDPEGMRVPGVGAFFERDGDTAYMAGVIDDRIVERVAKILKESTLKKIVMVYVPGSNHDHANLAAALRVHQAGIHVQLIEGGTIESGGVDFFVAGTKRSLGAHSHVGVHSWMGDRTSGYELRLDRSHRDHYSPFLNFYRKIGVPDRFYFFTLKFRPEEMHYMTQAELKEYGVF